MLNHKIGQFDCRKIDTRKAYARIPLNGLYNVIALEDLWPLLKSNGVFLNFESFVVLFMLFL